MGIVVEIFWSSFKMKNCDRMMDFIRWSFYGFLSIMGAYTFLVFAVSVIVSDTDQFSWIFWLSNVVVPSLFLTVLFLGFKIYSTGRDANVALGNMSEDLDNLDILLKSLSKEDVVSAMVEMARNLTELFAKEVEFKNANTTVDGFFPSKKTRVTCKTFETDIEKGKKGFGSAHKATTRIGPLLPGSIKQVAELDVGHFFVLRKRLTASSSSQDE